MDDDYQRMKSLDIGACPNPNPRVTGFTDSEDTCGVWHINIGARKRKVFLLSMGLDDMVGAMNCPDFSLLANPTLLEPLGPSKLQVELPLLGRNSVLVLYWLMHKCAS
ncbi:uncharacterized protein PGTG_20214 [Puccinia graminis f. sp. tritici CRL 75-36-700-3]|uniref:Uncharacterized protein n=1 Tax=Puccinia graminis f. sp. tritici (strain CRL 75-36-700-3 / race SCCL) TaxID=418459 RepID=E3NXH8_PUCGT|nr:uncharacterized protein PGTG_20214 [Puccinia graminis f. sp. tritici CRL 75-36-700-3]EFP94277.1 hypothetical protein PGTG_20214 [Puccinia graminis f. sp. tritici CRL 75-36-700-3]